MMKIKLSIEGDCAVSTICFPLYGKSENKKKWIEKNDLFLDTDETVYALVETSKEVFFMDVITGSLYQFGRCLTSSKLRNSRLIRNSKAADILMSKKAEVAEAVTGDVD